MSDREQAIVERLRRAYDAFSRADFDAATRFAHPEIEFSPRGGQGTLRGTAALRTWMEPDAFEEQRIEPLEFRVHGDKVLVRQRAWVRGAGSGIELEVVSWAVWTLDGNGLVTRLETYLPQQEPEALEAAGLAEPGGS